MTTTKRCPTCDRQLQRASAFVFNGRRASLYPKDIPVQRRDGTKFNFHEHRFYCATCQIEWIYSTRDRSFCEVPDNSQHVFNPETELLVAREDRS